MFSVKVHPGPGDAGMIGGGTAHQAPATAAAFVHAFAALRRAGDTAAAAALVDQLFTGRAPDGVPSTAGTALFHAVALDRTLPPALFRHLAERFDWRNPAGPAARADADRHAMLLDRIAAEDWFATLAAAAAKPGNPVAAAVLARPAGQAPVPVLDEAGKQQAGAVMAKLLRWDHILLDRLDARSLAALRQAVEGPPLVANRALTRRPLMPRGISLFLRRIGRSGQVALICFMAAVGLALWGAGGLLRPYVPPPGDVQARQVLDTAPDHWVSLRPLGGEVLVYFTSLVSSRAALRGIRYGLDRPVPDQDFPLPAAPPGPPAWPQPIGPETRIYVRASSKLRYVSVVLTYADGTTSAVRTFSLEESKQ